MNKKIKDEYSVIKINKIKNLLLKNKIKGGKNVSRNNNK